jgi:hypothetical protein
VNHSIRPQFAIPAAIVVSVVTLVLVVIIGLPGWDKPQTTASEPTILPSQDDEGAQRLDAWARPTTTDPKVLAIGYARAIWTYDTAKHEYDDWRDAVSVFADPTGEGPRIASSLLLLSTEWQQLKLHHASATVDQITAEITPEMKSLKQSSSAPKGWTGFVVRGKQTIVMDNDTIVAERQAAVGVVCRSICKFWSASAQINP